MSIIIRYFEDDAISHGSIYVSVDSCQLKLATSVSVEDAEKELAKLEVRLGRKATRTSGKTFSQLELHGFLD